MDCHILILEQMPLLDLSSLVRTNKYFSTLTANILRQKISRKMVIFTTFFNSMGITETNETIRVWNAATAVKILKRFSKSIRNLKLDRISFNEPENQEVFQLIEDYCSETLTQLHYSWVWYSVFENLETPFKNVHMISWNDQHKFEVLYSTIHRRSYFKWFPIICSIWNDSSCINTKGIKMD